jgi:ABC-type amino acid transport substrate-binding protein
MHRTVYRVIFRTKSICALMAVMVALLAVAVTGCRNATPVDAAQPKNPATVTVYDRVIKSGKIRAAYLTYPPAVFKDTVTGKLSGVFVEALEKAAENLGLTVEWTEEVGWGSQIEGLTADRYDIVGSPVWANPNRGKRTTLSRPLYFSGIGIYVRASDTRFSAANGWESINRGDVRVSTIDGETGDLIARTQFPKARRVSLPQTADISQLFLEVTNKKADVFFAEPYFALQYAKNNPNTVRNLAERTPIKVLGNCYMFKANEFQFKQMLDTALEDLINAGFVNELLAKHEGGETFYKANLPYLPK